MLVPYDRTVELLDYCSYLEHYYKENCNVITEVTGSNLVDAAETCLKKENELVSLWDSKSKEWVDGILPRKTYILSSLIQEFAGKVKRTGEGISVVSIAALLCITKEANLICEMLNYGANPTDYLIIQSTEIRMCALSLMSHQYGVPATAAMVGIMKETDKICDWLSKNNQPFDPFDMDLDNDFELGRQVRVRTLHLMISILAESPFSVPAAAGHKLVKEKSFCGNVPRNDGNDITPAEAANTTWDNLKDQKKITGADISRKRRAEGTNKEANDQELGSCQSRRKLSKTGSCHNLGLGGDPVVPLRRGYLLGSSEDIRENQMVCTDEDRRAFDFSSEDLEVGCDAARIRTVKLVDVLERTCGWDRLLPFKGSIAWSDYCHYLRQYYKCNANFVAELTGSLVASAEVCLKKEEQLVSLWKARVGYFPNEIWPVNSIIQSNLIQERASSIMCYRGQTFCCFYYCFCGTDLIGKERRTLCVHVCGIFFQSLYGYCYDI